MKNFSRIFPLSAFLMLLLSVFIFSCQKTDVEPVQKQEVVSQTPEFQMDGDADADADVYEVDCEEYNFFPLSAEELELLEEIGIDALSEELGIGECKNYETTSGGGQRYCNYIITRVILAGGPVRGDKFCVVCPPKCKPGGILWNANGYRAEAKLNQAGAACRSCFGGPIYPRRRR